MPFSKTASLSATRAVLDEFGLAAKYDLGQNFLVNDAVVGKIVDLAALAPDDAVLEVGPGIGTLTTVLLPRAAAVVSVEADPDMAGPLAVTTADYSERFALVQGDALAVRPAQLADALAGLRARSPHVAAALARELPNRWVANLPYAVAATLILKYFQEWPFIEDATVMVQSEVADRICAEPGTKLYGAYTLKLRLFARPTGRFQVPPTCFFPAPHVESAVIRLHRIPAAEALPADETLCVIEVVEAAFAQRRKTIRNSMLAAKLWAPERLDAAYAACGIEGSRRAETLTLDEYVALTRALHEGVSATEGPMGERPAGEKLAADGAAKPGKPARKTGKSARQSALDFDPDQV